MSHWMTLSEVQQFFGGHYRGFLDAWESELIEGHTIEDVIKFQRHEVINLKLDIMKLSNEVVR